MQDVLTTNPKPQKHDPYLFIEGYTVCESALLVQGRNLEQDGLPVNEALSLGVHESQSLLWERMVALSQPFAHYLLPKLQQHFPELAEKLTPETLYGAINVIREPSMIRVEADEVTYPLHIILR